MIWLIYQIGDEKHDSTFLLIKIGTINITVYDIKYTLFIVPLQESILCFQLKIITIHPPIGF